MLAWVLVDAWVRTWDGPLWDRPLWLVWDRDGDGDGDGGDSLSWD